MNEASQRILAQLVDVAAAVADAPQLNGAAAASPLPCELEIISAAELVKRVRAMPHPRFLVRGLWPADAYGVLAAEWKAGKTWANCDLAISVASATPWLGLHPIDRPGPVLMFLGEGGPRKMERRLQAICRSRGLLLEELPLRLCFRVPHLGSQFQLDRITEELKSWPAVLVILDPLYLAARGAKSSQLYEMGEVLEGIQQICQDADAALMLTTHWNRGEGSGSKRMTGAGPAEWGRVLVNIAAVSKTTDKETGKTTVVLACTIEGDEIAEVSFRIRRQVSGEDPTDIASDLHYEVTAVDNEFLTDDTDLAPSVARVLAVLEKAIDWLNVNQIGDSLAAAGWPLKRRTVQGALGTLRSMGLAASFGADGKAHSWRYAPLADPTFDHAEDHA